MSTLSHELSRTVAYITLTQCANDYLFSYAGFISAVSLRDFRSCELGVFA